MVSKESILNKTHYGLGIYSHILRLYYPDSIVLKLIERDCGKVRNPFNSNKETLHIFIEKENILGNALDREFARHKDSEISCKREQSSNSFETMPSVAEIATQNAIPAGDAFDFAELHYKQQGDELLKTLNKEMNLRIGEQWNFYQNKSPICPQSPELKISESQKQNPFSPLFSFFKAPISNTKPHKAVSLLQIYNAIKGNYYKANTEKLRAILSPLPCGERSGEGLAQARKFKASNFDYCTFSGVFTTRNDKALIKHSGLLCLDFDNLQSVELSCKRGQNSNSFEVMPSVADNVQKLRFQLLQDEYFDTQLLFCSPSGNGLKWIISVDTAETAHGNFFIAVANYILQTYGIVVDKSGRDISRACFLPHDPQVFINPIYLK